MGTRSVIVIGASAGGVQAVSQVVRDLPAGLPAAVFVVIHLAPNADSRLPEVIGRRASLPVSFATDGQPIQEARVYVAPQDHHMVLGPERVRVVHGPLENLQRP